MKSQNSIIGSNFAGKSQKSTHLEPIIGKIHEGSGRASDSIGIQFRFDS